MRTPAIGGARLLAIAVGALCAWTLAISPALSASPEALRECIIQNLPRYANPDRAVVAQYADIETSCRAALDGSEAADVEIVPAQSPAGRSPQGARAGTESGSAEGDDVSGRGSAPGSTPSPEVDAPGAGSPESEAAPTADDASAGAGQPALVADAILAGERDPARASPFSTVPAWLIALLAALGGVIAAGVLVGRRRSSRSRQRPNV